MSELPLHARRRFARLQQETRGVTLAVLLWLIVYALAVSAVGSFMQRPRRERPEPAIVLLAEIS